MFNRNFLISAIVVAFLLGFAGGYYMKGDVVAPVSDGLTTTNDEVDDEAVQSLIEEVNPYTDVEDAANPYKDAYTNPFE